MSIRLLANCCGVAEYRGTYHNFADEVLKRYAQERDSTDPYSYGNKQHTFVVMVFKKGYVEDFEKYVKEKELGSVVMGEWARNINHSGKWEEGNSGDEIQVVIYKPNHTKLTEWYKQFDEKYTLSNKVS
jgi:hypothetical protein